MWQLLATQLRFTLFDDKVGMNSPIGKPFPPPPPQSPSKAPSVETPPTTQAPDSDVVTRARRDADTIEEAGKTGVLDIKNATQVLRTDVLDLARNHAGLGPALEELDKNKPDLNKVIKLIRDATDSQIQRLKDQVDQLKCPPGPVREAPGPTKEIPAGGPTLEGAGPTLEGAGPTLEGTGPTGEGPGPKTGPTSERPGPTQEHAPGPTREHSRADVEPRTHNRDDREPRTHNADDREPRLHNGSND